jgi:CrcB protein
MPLILVALGGATGAVARYLIDGWIVDWAGGLFPWGTLAVNLTGSFLLGVAFAMTVEANVLPSWMRVPFMVGFVGAYTTFSTLMLESWRLWEDGAILLALGNILGSAALGMIAVVAGLTLGRAVS